jgi:hypothetical protein
MKLQDLFRMFTVHHTYIHPLTGIRIHDLSVRALQNIHVLDCPAAGIGSDKGKSKVVSLLNATKTYWGSKE